MAGAASVTHDNAMTSEVTVADVAVTETGNDG